MISSDEKPSIQALERTTGYVETDNVKIVRGFKSTNKRHGTLNLFAALRVATGQITSQITTTKRREDFLGFMDAIIAETPADNELHVILDNYCAHKRCDAWLAQHPNVHFHFTDVRQLAESGRNLIWHPVAQSPARRQLQEHRRPASSH